MSKYKVFISEPFDYSELNPIFGLSLGVILDDEGSQYLLLDLVPPILHEENFINQIVVSPRHSKNSINDVIQNTCVVGISKVKSNIKLDKDTTLIFSQIDYFAIGSITKEQE